MPVARPSLGNLGWVLRSFTVLVLGLALGSCATSQRSPAAPPAAGAAPLVATTPAPASLAGTPPEWRPGDWWLYEWASGNDSGTKLVELVEVKEINTVRYYVVRVGEVHHYYTLDLHWAFSVRDGRVEARMTPPDPYFVWPLKVGRQWTHRGAYETWEGKREQVNTFAVTGVESIDVPAGRFSAIKVTRQGGPRDSDEYWYVPDLRFYVRWAGRRDDVRFEERLREYHAAPRPGRASR